MRRTVQTSFLMAVMVLGLVVVGCNDDLYGDCSIDPEPGDPLNQCLMESETERRSCVASGVLECHTGTCGRYQGSRFFCTSTCASDEDCPTGVCRQFVLHQASYCVSNEDLPSN